MNEAIRKKIRVEEMRLDCYLRLDIQCNKDRGKWTTTFRCWLVWRSFDVAAVEVVGRKRRRSTLAGNWPKKDPTRRARDAPMDILPTDEPWPTRPGV